MNSLPLTYEEKPLFSQEQSDIFFILPQANVHQIKTLILLGAAVKMNNQDGIPVLIENLNQMRFKIKNSLDAYITLYRVFKDSVMISIKGVRRPLCYDDLLKFVL